MPFEEYAGDKWTSSINWYATDGHNWYHFVDGMIKSEAALKTLKPPRNENTGHNETIVLSPKEGQL